MNIFTAKPYATRLRLHIRRSIWVADLESPVAGGPTKRVTKWLVCHRSVWFLRYSTLVEGVAVWETRIVRAADILLADLRATDWTVTDAEGNGQTLPPDEPDITDPDVDDVDTDLPPIPPTNPPGSGGGGGGGDSGESGGSGSGGSGESGGSSPVIKDPPPTGGGSGGGGDSDSDRPPPKPDRAAPSVTVSATRTTEEECLGLLPSGQPNSDSIHDTFDVEVTFGADPDARPGEVWWLSIWAGGLDFGVRHSGTIVPGADVTVPITIKAFAGQQIVVKATVYLAGLGLNGSDTAIASMRPHCVGCIAPLIVGAGYVGGAPSEIGQLFTVQFGLLGNDPVVTFTMDGEPYSGSVETAEGIVTFTGSAPGSGGHHSLGVHVVGSCGSTGISFDMELS